MNPTGIKGQCQHLLWRSLMRFLHPLRWVLYCTRCAIMWSVPVCVCCTEAANVYRAGVSCGFRAGGRSLSLDQRVDTDTTRPTWDHRAPTERQSAVPCYQMGQTDRQYGRKLETRLRFIDVPVLCGETLTYNSFRKPCSLKTLSL